MRSRRCGLVAVIAALLLVGCQAQNGGGTQPDPPRDPRPASSSEGHDVVRMPNLVGLPSAEAGRRIGELEASHKLGISSSWRSEVITQCGVRPSSVTRQRPAPGSALRRRTVVHVRAAALNLDRFRGPCEPVDGDLGPVAGRDARLARQFYRFAADPALGAPFVDDEVWVGIEDGMVATSLDVGERPHLDAWELETGYAEAIGPFSALDVVAASGGYYEVHRGVARTCPSGDDDAPPGFAELRPISLTAPADTTSSCSQWWAVTLFLTHENKIRGVALGLGSP